MIENVKNSISTMITKVPYEDPIFLNILLGIVSVSLFTFLIAIIFLIYKARDEKNIIGKLQRFNEDLVTEAIKNISKTKTTKSFYEYIDLLLSRSQIKYTFRFNFWMFCIVTLLFFLFGLYTFMDVTENYLTSLLAGAGFGFIPYVCLEAVASIKTKKIKSQILTLIPVLINNTKLTSGDVFQTIKKSVPKTQEPMRIYLDEFVDEYESGLNTEICFEHLKSKVMDVKFTRLIDALEIHLYKGGNVAVTLNSIQKEYLAREIEEDRRKKESFANVLGIYITVLANFYIVYMTGNVMPEVLVELKGSDYSINVLVAVMSTLLSLFIAFKATKVGNHKK